MNDSKGDFKQDMERNLLSNSGEVRSRSGLVQNLVCAISFHNTGTVAVGS